MRTPATSTAPLPFAGLLRLDAAGRVAGAALFAADRCGLAAPLAARGGGFATSRVTSLAALSSRRPLNDGWRSTPSSVQPANATCATSSGSTQWTPRALYPLGGSTTARLG